MRDEEDGVKAVCLSSCKSVTAIGAGSVDVSARESVTLVGAQNGGGYESTLKEYGNKSPTDFGYFPP